MTITVYNTVQRVMLTQTISGVPNLNMPMNSTDFKIYRNAPVEIEFTIKNNDRKPIQLAGKKLICHLIDSSNGSALLKRELEVLDSQKGKAVLRVLPPDSVQWNLGFHQYSIQIQDSNGDTSLLYFSDVFDAGGHFEVLESVTPRPVQAIEVNGNAFTSMKWNQYEETYWISSALPGGAQAGYTDTLHTIALYGDNFSGRFLLQGSVENQPSLEWHNWFPIDLTPESSDVRLKDFTGIEAFNFRANVLWVRFVYQPDVSNKGSIKKILYKN